MRNLHLSADLMIQSAIQNDDSFDTYLTQYLTESKKKLKENGTSKRPHVQTLRSALDVLCNADGLSDKNFRIFLSKIIYPIASIANTNELREIREIHKQISKILDKSVNLRTQFVALITQNNNHDDKSKILLWPLIGTLIQKERWLGQMIPGSFTSDLINELQILTSLVPQIYIKTKRTSLKSLMERRHRPRNLMNMLNYCNYSWTKAHDKINVQKVILRSIYLLSYDLTKNVHANMNILKEIHEKITLSKDTKLEFLEITIQLINKKMIPQIYGCSFLRQIDDILTNQYSNQTRDSLNAQALILKKLSIIPFKKSEQPSNELINLLYQRLLLICNALALSATNIAIAKFIARYGRNVNWQEFSQLVLRFIKSPDKATRREALITLYDLIKRNHIPQELINRELVDTLLEILENEDADLRLQSLYVFRHLSENADTRVVIRTKNLFDKLLIKIKSPDTLNKKISMQLLLNLTTHTIPSSIMNENFIQTCRASIDSKDKLLASLGLKLFLRMEECRTMLGIKNDNLVQWCSGMLEKHKKHSPTTASYLKIISNHAAKHDTILDKSLLKPVLTLLNTCWDIKIVVEPTLNILLNLATSHAYENTNANKKLFSKMLLSKKWCETNSSKLAYIKLIKELLKSHQELFLPSLNKLFFGTLNNWLSVSTCDKLKQQVLYVLLDLKKSNKIKDCYITKTLVNITTKLCKHKNETIKKSAQSFFEMIKPNTISQDGKNNHGLFGNKRKRVEDTSQEAPTNSRRRLK